MIEPAIRIWMSGGWLMIPLLLLTVFIYANALNLFFRVHFHFLLRKGTEHEKTVRQLLCTDALGAEDVRRHFEEVRNEYLPYIDRRIRFLGIIVAAGPLLGLLGTVSGMLSTFSGMLNTLGNRFGSIVTGISEALITTQTGLIISIPAMVILSHIIQRRNALVLAISRLERYNTRLALRSNCPIPPVHRQTVRAK